MADSPLSSEQAGGFPRRRPRRLRRTAALRQAVRDVTVQPDHLILPLFVTQGQTSRPVESMPGVHQLPVAEAVSRIGQLRQRGLCQFLLFGVTPAQAKDARGSFACSADAPVNRVLSQVRDQAGEDVVLYADTCLCEYTDHGHCGELETGGSGDGEATVQVDNDRTLALLGQVAVAQARAGATVVAPSAMMDGQVAAIRAALDDAGFTHVPIMSYSVKYASDFYGPFREAGEGAMKFGDRRGYQMDYRRGREWQTELATDLAEGADIVLVKPAATYLDVIHRVRQSCSVPVAAYHVSGEYAMLHAAAARGWLDLRATAVETTCAIRRAGADLIITYFAPDLLEWL